MSRTKSCRGRVGEAQVPALAAAIGVGHVELAGIVIERSGGGIDRRSAGGAGCAAIMTLSPGSWPSKSPEETAFAGMPMAS